MSIRGQNLYSFHRSGTRRYASRPPANCAAARAAWDAFAKDGPVEWIQLLDGYWGCQRPGVDVIEERDAVHFRRGR